MKDWLRVSRFFMVYRLKIFIIFIFQWMIQPVYAQVDFLQKTFNLGILENWSETPAEFVFVNRGTKPVAVVGVHAEDDLYVKYPKNYIQPNEKGIIKVFYEPRETGFFNKKILVYLNVTNKAVELTIRGNVKAILECPGPGASYYFYTSNSILLNGIVVDSRTNLPIPRAGIRFLTPYNKSFIERSQKDGRFEKKLEKGTYAISVNVAGYHPYNEIFQLNLKNNFLCIDLEPLDITNTGAESDSIAEQTESTFTIEKDIVTDTVNYISPNPSLSNYQEGVESLDLKDYKPNNIVFLLDVSENPANPAKLPNLKSLLNNVIKPLRSSDYISFIAFSDTVSILLYPVSAGGKAEIAAVTDSLKLSGNADGIRGLDNSYNMVLRNYLPQGNNEIIIISDRFMIPSVSRQTTLYLLGSEIGSSGVLISYADFGAYANNPVLKQFLKGCAGNYISLLNKNEATQNLISELKKHCKK